MSPDYKLRLLAKIADKYLGIANLDQSKQNVNDKTNEFPVQPTNAINDVVKLKGMTIKQEQPIKEAEKYKATDKINNSVMLETMEGMTMKEPATIYRKGYNKYPAPSENTTDTSFVPSSNQREIRRSQQVMKSSKAEVSDEIKQMLLKSLEDNIPVNPIRKAFIETSLEDEEKWNKENTKNKDIEYFSTELIKYENAIVYDEVLKKAIKGSDLFRKVSEFAYEYIPNKRIYMLNFDYPRAPLWQQAVDSNKQTTMERTIAQEKRRENKIKKEEKQDDEVKSMLQSLLDNDFDQATEEHRQQEQMHDYHSDEDYEDVNDNRNNFTDSDDELEIGDLMNDEGVKTNNSRNINDLKDTTEQEEETEQNDNKNKESESETKAKKYIPQISGTRDTLKDMYVKMNPIPTTNQWSKPFDFTGSFPQEYLLSREIYPSSATITQTMKDNKNLKSYTKSDFVEDENSDKKNRKFGKGRGGSRAAKRSNSNTVQITSFRSPSSIKQQEKTIEELMTNPIKEQKPIAEALRKTNPLLEPLSSKSSQQKTVRDRIENNVNSARAFWNDTSNIFVDVDLNNVSGIDNFRDMLKEIVLKSDYVEPEVGQYIIMNKFVSFRQDVEFEYIINFDKSAFNKLNKLKKIDKSSVKEIDLLGRMYSRILDVIIEQNKDSV